MPVRQVLHGRPPRDHALQPRRLHSTTASPPTIDEALTRKRAGAGIHEHSFSVSLNAGYNDIVLHMQNRTDLGLQPESRHAAMTRILILRTGKTAAEVSHVHGDYDRWFTDAIAARQCLFDICDVTSEAIPPLHRFAGVIVTGSVSAAYRHEPWMTRLNSFLSELDPHATPVLG